MQDGFAGVAEAIEGINGRLDTQDKKIDDFGHRITRLEQRTA